MVFFIDLGWNWTDPLCSIAISVMTVIGTYPLLKQSTEILLQRIPRPIENNLSDCYSTLNRIPGVLGISKAHFWELKQDDYCGSIVVHCKAECSRDMILSNVQTLFRQAGVGNINVQIVEDNVQSY